MDQEFRPLEYKTKFFWNGGSLFLHIPPDLKEHLQIKPKEKAQARVRTELNTRGQPYISAWVEGT